jgi:hypothetical protein
MALSGRGKKAAAEVGDGWIKDSFLGISDSEKRIPLSLFFLIQVKKADT